MSVVDLSHLTTTQLSEIAKYVQGLPSALVPTKPKKTYIALVLDKSSSMWSCLAPTIAGFNDNINLLKNKAEDGGETFVTLVTFNHLTSVVYLNQPVSRVRALTPSDYIPGGNTALYDGINAAINQLKMYDSPDVDAAFLVSVFTDGQENASYIQGPQLSATITELTKKGNWTFTVAGANIDLMELSRNIGVPVQDMFRYQATPMGTQIMYSANANSLEGYMSKRSMGASSSAGSFYDNANAQNDLTNEQKKLVDSLAKKKTSAK